MCLAEPGRDWGSRCFDFKGLLLLGSPSSFPQKDWGQDWWSAFLHQVGEGPGFGGPKEVQGRWQRLHPTGLLQKSQAQKGCRQGVWGAVWKQKGCLEGDPSRA